METSEAGSWGDTLLRITQLGMTWSPPKDTDFKKKTRKKKSESSSAKAG